MPRLFFRVLVEFFLDGFARNSLRGDGVHGVTQNADNFGCEDALQDFDRLLDVALVRGSNRTVLNGSAGARTQFFHIGEEWLIFGGHWYPRSNEHAGFHCESEDMENSQ